MLLSFKEVRSTLAVKGWEEGHDTLTIDRQGLVRLIEKLLAMFPFDEAWYLSAYPDVKAAVEAGTLESGYAHYMQFGFYEGRLPGLKGFDAEAYLTAYSDLEGLKSTPDPAAAALQHFFDHGWEEGRLVPAKRTR